MPPLSTRRRYLALAGSALLGTTAGCAFEAPSQEETTTTDSTTTQPTTGPAQAGDSGRFSRVYRDTIDSVVYIEVTSSRGTGSGSGFIFDDGHVVTNHHVVAGASEVTVRFNRGDWSEATITATDPYSDLAVLSIDRPDYATPLPMVESEPPIGTEILAVGHPFGLDRSATAGIISGVDRNIPAPAGQFDIADGVQTDAAVNPGNSGGPLVTLDGEVAGVVSSGGGENIAFAVSVPLLERVVPSIIETGEYTHPYMGIGLQTVTPSIAEANDLERAEGVIVTRVLDGGPSDGVLRGSPDTEYDDGAPIPVGGDVIRTLADSRIAVLNDLSEFIALETSPGETIDVTVLRDGERTTVALELGARPQPGTLSS